MKIGSINLSTPVQTTMHSTKNSATELNVEMDTVAEVESIPVTTEVITDESIYGIDGLSGEELASKNDELLKKSVEQANKSLKQYDRKIEMSIHEVTKAVMYTIRDTRTNEVISEFPPRKIQDMIAKMWELAGLFVDEKA